MALIKSIVIVVTLVQLSVCTPLETNCTKVDSIDGSVGVNCHRTRQVSDKFEPTIIQQHFVDLFARAKREAPEDEEAAALQISELFIQNLQTMAQANMSDCMDRVNCEEKCKLIADGVFKASDDNQEIDGLDSLPDFVRSFYNAGKKGIKLGESNECAECENTYKNCNEMQYDYTIKTNALYKDLIEKNVTLFDSSENQEEIPEEIAYLHHSMRFLDLANLSRCYARVSCEATCVTVKNDPTIEAPPAKSPLLENDPFKPKSVDIIHEGALLGYTLASRGNCETCATQYEDCPEDRYTIAHSSSVIFG